jgi:type II secretory pathway pseudopilin PulG
MEPEATSEKPRFNWKRLLVTVGIVLLAASLIGGTVWYFMDKQAREDRAAAEETAQELQKQIDDLDKKITVTSTTSTPNSTKTTTTTLTNDQIYSEVAKQFSLTRNNIESFRIYGQDKVQYNVNSPMGTGFVAYKTDGTWKKADLGQAVQLCSTYANVPISYRPPCDENGKTLYMAADRSWTNYPMSTEVIYIGQ